MMRAERLYTLPELAEITGRSYDFWDRQCRQERLAYLQHDSAGLRLITASAYAHWVQCGEVSDGVDKPVAAAASCRARVPAWADF